MARRLDIGGVTFSLHSAGHVLGSAQAAAECGGTRVVVSGDYKRQPDPTCAPFEVVPCDVFITEATFALPVFTHPSAEHEVRKLLASVAMFPERAHVVGAYALGKAQRVMAELRRCGWDKPIFVHGALVALTELYQAARRRSGRCAPRRDGAEELLCRRDRALPAGRAADAVGAALSRSGDLLCLGLDAHPRAGAPARRGAAAGDLRSRRLGRSAAHDSETPAPAKSGSRTARPMRWRIGARRQGLKAKALHLVGYGDEEERTGARAHEPLRRPPRSPGL